MWPGAAPARLRRSGGGEHSGPLPDGRFLLYSAAGEIQLLDLSTLASRTLTLTTGGTMVERANGEVIAVPPHSHHASFTPDGGEIVYASTVAIGWAHPAQATTHTDAFPSTLPRPRRDPASLSGSEADRPR